MHFDYWIYVIVRLSWEEASPTTSIIVCWPQIGHKRRNRGITKKTLNSKYAPQLPPTPPPLEQPTIEKYETKYGPFYWGKKTEATSLSMISFCCVSILCFCTLLSSRFPCVFIWLHEVSDSMSSGCYFNAPNNLSCPQSVFVLDWADRANHKPLYHSTALYMCLLWPLDTISSLYTLNNMVLVYSTT